MRLSIGARLIVPREMTTGIPGGRINQKHSSLDSKHFGNSSEEMVRLPGFRPTTGSLLISDGRVQRTVACDSETGSLLHRS